MARARLGGLGRGLDSLFADLPAWEPEEGAHGASEAGDGSLSDQGGAGRTAAGSAVGSSASSDEPSATTRKSDDHAEDVVYISIDDIKPNSMQPRKTFSQEALDELADSIREYGVIQPVLVRKSGVGYELVAGERRWRAARLAGLKRVPAIVRELSDRENAFFALIENMQRADLNSIEEAEGLSRMMDEFGLTHEEAGKAIGKSRAYVSNALRLLRLPEQVRQLVVSGSLSAGHARAIAGLSGENLQIQVAKKAASQGWSVRKLESYAGTKTAETGRPSRKRTEQSAEVAAAEEELTRALGTKVRINGSEDKGRLELEYYSRDELERLIEILSAVSEGDLG